LWLKLDKRQHLLLSFAFTLLLRNFISNLFLVLSQSHKCIANEIRERKSHILSVHDTTTAAAARNVRKIRDSSSRGREER
jgi:hypothetical protein